MLPVSLAIKLFLELFSRGEEAEYRMIRTTLVLNFPELQGVLRDVDK